MDHPQSGTAQANSWLLEISRCHLPSRCQSQWKTRYLVTKIQDRTGGRVNWIRKESTEDKNSYFTRITRLQKIRNQPIIWRTGGGSDLGFEVRTGDSNPNLVRSFSLRGPPATWDSDDARDFLVQPQWTDVCVSIRKNRTWFLRAKPPFKWLRPLGIFKSWTKLLGTSPCKLGCFARKCQ